MNDDFKSLDKLIENYKSNETNETNETNEIIKELETIKMSWTKHKLYIDNEVEWDDLDEAETKFNTLREKDKIYIEDLISKNTNDSSKKEDWEEDWEEEQEKEREEEFADTPKEKYGDTLKEELGKKSKIDNTSFSIEKDTTKIKLIRPKKIFGDLPGVKKRGKVQTSQEIGATCCIKEEDQKTESYDLNMIVDDIIKVIREIHQNPDFIKWIQEHFTGNGKIKQTLSSLKPLMKTPSCSISNKSRIETISSYKQGYKQYNIINLIIKGKTTFSINLIEELYNQIVYILHNNLHTYDVDKLIAIFDLLIKNKGSNLLAYISSKTLDSDKYCIKL